MWSTISDNDCTFGTIILLPYPSVIGRHLRVQLVIFWEHFGSAITHTRDNIPTKLHPTSNCIPTTFSPTLPPVFSNIATSFGRTFVPTIVYIPTTFDPTFGPTVSLIALGAT